MNAFTAAGFGGSPTAVYFSGKPIESEAMQTLATSLPVPVTAFVWEEGRDCCIRYFTPRCEIGACGHATLGAAAVSAEALQTDTVNFITASGTNIRTTVNGGCVTMRYAPLVPVAADPNEEVWQSLGLKATETTEAFRCSDTLVVVLNDAEAVVRLRPDIRRLQSSDQTLEEVVVTAAPRSGEYDYVLRSFCPWIGIDEDPVTGSVQAVLAPYWSRRLGKQSLKAYQASARGGEVLTEVIGGTVAISGQCGMLSPLRGS